MKNRKYNEIKYKTAWNVGALFSFLLYFSGIAPLYIFLRKNFFKRYIMLVLTYHRIHNGSDDANISVRVETFKQQMAYLKKNFKIVSLNELVRRLKNGYSLTNDVIAVTFDDGWKDNYTNAFQIIKDCGSPAAIFITTSFIGKDYGLTEDEIRTMHKNNITFGAHTISHKSLSELDYKTALMEIANSKLELEKILQEEVKYFSYPYGKKGRDFNVEIMDAVKKSGFIAAFSTNNGCITRKSSLFALERIGIRNVPFFIFKVRVSGIFGNKWFHVLWKYLRI